MASYRRHMPGTSKEDCRVKKSFTQYRSEDYSIIDYPDESSVSSVIHSPELTPQPVYRHLSSQLPPTTLRHKYIAFRNLKVDGTDAHPIINPLSA